MRLKIEHITSFEYDDPISEAYTEVRLKPQDRDGQRCLSFTLQTEPRAEIFAYRDQQGNEVHSFDVLLSHERLSVRVASEVVTAAAYQPENDQLDLLERYDYLQATAQTPREEPICKLLGVAPAPGDEYATALALMQATYQALKYEKGATTVETTALEALQLGRGVCQDYSHVMLAACRCLGMPARYVSGYLYSPSAHPSAQATHAWVDVYVGGRGWVALDPTHGCPQGEQHVRVAVGRDYNDVPPTRGVYTGLSAERMTVKVHVRPA